MRDNIIAKLHEIRDILVNSYSPEDIGLMGGASGVALFLAEYGKFFNDSEAIDKTISLLEYINDAQNMLMNKPKEGFPICGFSEGAAGVFWTQKYLQKIEILQEDEEGENDQILDLFSEFSKFTLLNNNYDYLYGGTGMLLALLGHHSFDYKMEELLEMVVKISKVNSEIGRYWVRPDLKGDTEFKEENLTLINLGLAHGIPSILTIMAKCYKSSYQQLNVLEIINQSVKSIFMYKTPLNDSLSLFPDSNTLKDIPSRLGWCYGDLGIGIMFALLGKKFNNVSWSKMAIEICIHASERRNLFENRVVDAGLCHGTAGISHIYNRMYRYTGIERFKETSDFWMQETLKMGRFKDGLAGYKTDHGPDEGLVNDYGLLEGIAGIGLALLANIDDKDPAWDECLLLS